MACVPPFRPSHWTGLQGDLLKQPDKKGGPVELERERRSFKFLKIQVASLSLFLHILLWKLSERFKEFYSEHTYLHHLDSCINILLYSFLCISTHLAIHLSTRKPSYFSDAFLSRLQTSGHPSKHLSPQEPMDEVANHYFATQFIGLFSYVVLIVLCGRYLKIPFDRCGRWGSRSHWMELGLNLCHTSQQGPLFPSFGASYCSWDKSATHMHPGIQDPASSPPYLPCQSLLSPCRYVPRWS